MKMKTYEKGQLVTYVPAHAKGNLNHKDCERGRVTSLNAHYVFVQFGTDFHAKACRPEDLVP